jgi:hypothetical protein
LVGSFFPFSIRSAKKVENRTKKQAHKCNSGGNGKKKKGTKKGAKRGYCEIPGLKLPFSTLFDSLFPFHAPWVLLLFLKVRHQLECSKRPVVNFSELYTKHEKGCKKGAKRPTVNKPNFHLPTTSRMFTKSVKSCKDKLEYFSILNRMSPTCFQCELDEEIVKFASNTP